MAATGGAAEVNIDPSIRIKFGELAQIAELHVRDLTGFDGKSPEVLPVTSGAWAQRTLEAYRPLFTELATSLGQPVAPSDDDEIDLNADPMMAMMANLSKMMAPSMMGMAVGSMVGRMATQAFGQHDLRSPGRTPASPSFPATSIVSPRNGASPLTRCGCGFWHRSSPATPSSRSHRSARISRRWCGAMSAPSSPIPRQSPRSSHRSTVRRGRPNAGNAAGAQ